MLHLGHLYGVILLFLLSTRGWQWLVSNLDITAAHKETSDSCWASATARNHDTLGAQKWEVRLHKKRQQTTPELSSGPRWSIRLPTGSLQFGYQHYCTFPLRILWPDQQSLKHLIPINNILLQTDMYSEDRLSVHSNQWGTAGTKLQGNSWHWRPRNPGLGTLRRGQLTAPVQSHRASPCPQVCAPAPHSQSVFSLALPVTDATPVLCVRESRSNT